jgi:hypothetical protein
MLQKKLTYQIYQIKKKLLQFKKYLRNLLILTQ